MRIYINTFNIRVVVISLTIALLLFCTMFLSFRVFVEAEVLSKWYIIIAGSLLFCSLVLFASKADKIIIDSTTVLTTIFIGYLLIASLLSPLTQNSIHILSLIVFILLYLSFKIILNNYTKNIDIIVISVCLVQACFGLLQYTGIVHTYNTFTVVGSFDNPTGFAACLITGYPFVLSTINKRKWKRFFGIISVVIITASIILSGSRAGIISVIIVSIIYFGNKHYKTLKKYRKYILLVFVMLFFIGVGLFFLKKNSAIGRVFIWKTSLEMVAEQPILGHGASSFLGNYMQHQADYFEQNSDSRYSMLAGNIPHPLNEYLFLTIEYGIIGLLLLLVITFVVIKSSKKITIYHLCLLSVGVFAYFSYPLRYPFVIVLIVYSLVNITTKEIFTLKINSFVRIVGVILVGSISWFLIRDIQFERNWGILVQKSKFGNYSKLLDDYEKLYYQWNGDPMFVYNYGAVLNRVEQYQRSNEILIECTKYFNDYDVQMLIAENYSKLEQWNKAEAHYYTASNMIPSKFMSLYKLMLLYESTGNNHKRHKIANIIISKPVKISSGTISHIKNESKKVIDLN